MAAGGFTDQGCSHGGACPAGSPLGEEWEAGWCRPPRQKWWLGLRLSGKPTVLELSDVLAWSVSGLRLSQAKIWAGSELLVDGGKVMGDIHAPAAARAGFCGCVTCIHSSLLPRSPCPLLMNLLRFWSLSNFLSLLFSLKDREYEYTGRCSRESLLLGLTMGLSSTAPLARNLIISPVNPFLEALRTFQKSHVSTVSLQGRSLLRRYLR